MKIRSIRAVAVALGLAVVGAGALVPAPVMASTTGTVTLTPSTGNADSLITLTTSGPCSAAAANVQAIITGFGFTGEVVLRAPGTTGLSKANPMNLAVENSFLVYAQDNGTALVGAYQLKVQCVDALGSQVIDEFAATMNWTTPGNALANVSQATYTSSVPNASTTTTLGTSVASPQNEGTAIGLTATVDAGASDPSVGSVKFFRGATLIGEDTTVVSGAASLSNVTLPVGTHSLTAQYVPGSGFNGSTSGATSYTINAIPLQSFVKTASPTITGTAQVGVVLKATTGTWNPTPTSVTYQWLRNGSPIAGKTASYYTPVAYDYGKSISVRVTVAKPTYTTTSAPSAAYKVKAGTFKVSKNPSISGTVKVGKTISVYRGSYSPTPSSYSIQWLRNGSPISGKTAATYKVSSFDKGKTISVKVTAKATGYTSITRISAGKKAY